MNLMHSRFSKDKMSYTKTSSAIKVLSFEYVIINPFGRTRSDINLYNCDLETSFRFARFCPQISRINKEILPRSARSAEGSS